MFVRFEENPNCGFVDDRVWKELGDPRQVSHVLRQRNSKDVWCLIAGLNEKNERIPAMGIKVEDSGEGTCWLVYGGLWGLVLTDPDTQATWGEAFMLLPPTGADLRFT